MICLHKQEKEIIMIIILLKKEEKNKLDNKNKKCISLWSTWKVLKFYYAPSLRPEGQMCCQWATRWCTTSIQLVYLP